MVGIDTHALRKWISEKYGVSLPAPILNRYDLEVPFVTGRAKTGTLILQPAHKARNKADPFDRPEPEIRAWVRGIIWRDEHFRGMPLQKIAAREGVSHAHILKYINKSLSLSKSPEPFLPRVGQISAPNLKRNYRSEKNGKFSLNRGILSAVLPGVIPEIARNAVALGLNSQK